MFEFDSDLFVLEKNFNQSLILVSSLFFKNNKYILARFFIFYDFIDLIIKLSFILPKKERETQSKTKKKKKGPDRGLNPEPLAPNSRIISLDH